MVTKLSFLKCRSCGYEFAKEDLESHSVYYCPKCHAIGNVQEQFIRINV